MAKSCNIMINLCILLANSVLASAGSLTGTVRAGGSGTSIVYLEPVEAKAPAVTPQRSYVMGQTEMQFSPHVLAVPVGATVVFKNEDAVAHNVFWPSVGGNKKMAHDLGTFMSGQQRTYRFDNPGVVPVLCNLHPGMEGYIIVTPTPYYAQADQILGLYQIPNVPNGHYKVTAWHIGKKTESKIVSIVGDARVDFDLSR